MKKKFSFFILFILVNLAAIAQQEPLYSNYMLSRPVTNPGFVGADKTINAIFINRTMFAGIEGKPVTSVFGIEAPIDVFGARSGLGLVIMSDKLGFQNSVNVDATYAYHHVLPSGTLGGGVTIGFNNYAIVSSSWTPIEGDYWTTAASDPAVPNDFSTLTLGIGAGVYYETPKYYLGLSVSKLNSADVVYSTETEEVGTVYYYVPTYYLTGAYNIELPDPLFDLHPSFLLRSDLAAFSLDVNGTIYYKDKYWAGFGLRVSPSNLSALTFLGGLELTNGLSVGYALDINPGMFLGGLTSHEVLIRYSFNLETKRNQKYKSVRYL